MDEWQTLVQLPETPSFWRRVFHPRHTIWKHEGVEFLREKADALNVLFFQNPHFCAGHLLMIWKIIYIYLMQKMT